MQPPPWQRPLPRQAPRRWPRLATSAAPRRRKPLPAPSHSTRRQEGPAFGWLGPACMRAAWPRSLGLFPLGSLPRPTTPGSPYPHHARSPLPPPLRPLMHAPAAAAAPAPLPPPSPRQWCEGGHGCARTASHMAASRQLPSCVAGRAGGGGHKGRSERVSSRRQAAMEVSWLPAHNSGKPAASCWRDHIWLSGRRLPARDHLQLACLLMGPRACVRCTGQPAAGCHPAAAPRPTRLHAPSAPIGTGLACPAGGGHRQRLRLSLCPDQVLLRGRRRRHQRHTDGWGPRAGGRGGARPGWAVG